MRAQPLSQKKRSRQGESKTAHSLQSSPGGNRDKAQDRKTLRYS
jgi:hypothetical protein